MIKLHHAKEDFFCDHCEEGTARIGFAEKEGSTVDDDMYAVLCIPCVKSHIRDLRDLVDKEGLRRKLEVTNGEEQ